MDGTHAKEGADIASVPLAQPRQYAVAVASAGAASLSLNGERRIGGREPRLWIGVYGARKLSG